jgi:hypothetical protein
MKRRIGAVLLLLVSSAALGYVRAYSIDPVKAVWSGLTRTAQGQDYVSQTVTVNFDSLVYVELFAGDSGASRFYTATVFEDGAQITQAVGQQRDDCSWVKFENWDQHPAFTKGKRYEFKFTRTSGSDSIDYYFQNEDPYGYGDIVAGGSPISCRDLCMRCYGVMNVIDSMFCGMDDESGFGGGATDTAVWAESAREVGVGMVRRYIWWPSIQWDSTPTYHFEELDSALATYRNAGCEVLASLVGCPTWASTRIDSTLFSPPGGAEHWVYDTSIYAAPHGLDISTDSADNLWAAYLRGLVRHTDSSGCTLHTFEIWNEPNDGDSVCYVYRTDDSYRFGSNPTA